MILAELGPVTAYRMHAPKWATAPTSGAGAAAHGGRANRPGTSALYLSLEAQTAVREYQQLSPLMPPGTLVSYTLRLAPVVDFRAGYDPGRWSGLWEEFYCDWRELWFDQRVEPPAGFWPTRPSPPAPRRALRLEGRPWRRESGRLQRCACRARHTAGVRPGRGTAEESGFLALSVEGSAAASLRWCLGPRGTANAAVCGRHQLHDKYPYHVIPKWPETLAGIANRAACNRRASLCAHGKCRI